jgi:hypothetical protein
MTNTEIALRQICDRYLYALGKGEPATGELVSELAAIAKGALNTLATGHDEIKMNCATCKNWTDDTDDMHYMGIKHVRRCASPKLAEPLGIPNDVDTSDMLIYSYDEGGRFYTGPNFGCVHWEAK